MPVPMILMVVPFGTLMLGLWVLRLARPSLRRRSRKIGHPIFIVGSTPLSRRFLVIDRGGILLVDGRRRRLGSWPRHRVDVTALRPFGNAEALLIVADDRFFELPISHAVGGPAAPFWSNGGAVGFTDLRKLVSRQLGDAGYLRVHDSLVD